jgi:NADP-dependent 3-hydroxy acid dehydrogenase YdfG
VTTHSHINPNLLNNESKQAKKVALVTGASSGMGKEIAKRLIQDGFVVYAAARQVDKMDDLAKLGAKALRLDISKEEEIEATVATILK